jgi:hypothetical protein
MKCPECGRENPDNAIMCAECGWVLVWVRPDEPGIRTSRLAIASAVLGVASLLCFMPESDRIYLFLLLLTSGLACIAAVVLGIAAMACIELDHTALKGRKYALIGIVLSVITSIMISILSSLP